MVSASERCVAKGEIFKNSLGKTISEKQAKELFNPRDKLIIN